MASLIRMPEISANMTAAVLVGWQKAEGDTVRVGDSIADIETEKAVIEYAAEADGVMGRQLVAPGTEVTVGAPIAVLLAEGEQGADVDALLRAEGMAPATADVQSDTAPAPQAETAGQAVSAGSSGVSAPDDGRVRASPLARRMAADAGIRLADLQGSGPQGRIVKRDVLAARAMPAPQPAAAVPVSAPSTLSAVPSAAPAAAVEAGNVRNVPHSGMRRTIARRLLESKTTVPHFYLKADCRVDALLALRKQVNAVAPRKVSVNDIVVKAVAAALREEPAMNVAWTDEAMLEFDDVDIAVAVATPGGLLTPVVRGADQLSVSRLGQAIADLAARAREGRLGPADYQGGSFTVSNLGMYGVEEFSAIINPPQAAILAVGAASKRPVVADDGSLAVASVMSVTLSVDHRAIDGAVAARWLAAFRRIVENPLTALV